VAGDVITAVDGRVVKDAHDLARKIGATAPGTSVKLSILHKGEDKTVSLTLGEISNQHLASTETQRPERTTPRLGLTLAPANDVGGAGD
jgi:serine protease Do